MAEWVEPFNPIGAPGLRARSGNGLCHPPTAKTSVKLLDAYLWVKTPGSSDGTCNGGPPSGAWWQSYALMLARNAHLG